MKAAQFTGYGDPSDHISINVVDRPSIGANDVLIESYAAGVNPLDFKVIEGALKRIRKFKLPATLGYDISGRISAVGENVKDFKVGDEVFSKVRRQGTFADFVAVDQRFVSLKPKNLNFVEASSLPLVGLTAIQALSRAKIKQGDKVLILQALVELALLAFSMQRRWVLLSTQPLAPKTQNGYRNLVQIGLLITKLKTINRLPKM